LIERGADTGGRLPAMAAVGFAVVMLCFARPQFSADLKRMNTVRPQTQAAEALVSDVWGDLFARVFVMAEGDSLSDLQAASDRIGTRLEQDRVDGIVADFFVPSMIFPGAGQRQANLAAWKAFWTPERVAAVSTALRDAGGQMGFAPAAFDPFIRSIAAPADDGPVGISPEFYTMLGISPPPGGNASAAAPIPWRLFATVTPGNAYAGDTFSAAIRKLGARVFDPSAYARRLGEVLGETFGRMLLVIGGSVVVLLLIFYRSWKLTLVSLLPVAFSLVCTLGTLNLFRHPLDLAGLMLSIIVVGMGIDYALFMVRAHQRYGSGSDPRLGLIRLTVFLAAASTLIGFGAMNFADHRLLRSAGFTCFFGIFYAYLGAAVLLPPVLRRLAPRRPMMSERES
jgi:predicted exporter